MSGSLFAPHGLNAEGSKKAARIQQIFEGLLIEVESVLTGERHHTTVARELALVRTKLQEASFFAVRALVLLPENQK